MIFKDTVAPVVLSGTLTPDAVVGKIGDTFLLTITADGAGYSDSGTTVNGEALAGFTNNGDNTYTGTYTVVSGNTDRASGAIPVNIVLSDVAGNANGAFTAVDVNTVAIDANAPTVTVTST